MPRASLMNVGKFLLLHDADNVLVCCRAAQAGETVMVDGNAMALMQDVDVGHKVARTDIRRGEGIIKYGVSIGSATDVIGRGGHVHLHNMKSDYFIPHGRKRLTSVSKYK